MASSRLARFVMEVTPSQYTSIVRRRRRATQILDTIKEEDHRDVSVNEFSNLAKTSSASNASPAPAGGAMAATMNSKYFLREVQKSFSVFEH